MSSDCLLGKLGIKDIEDVLRVSRMRWLGHVERSTGQVGCRQRSGMVSKTSVKLSPDIRVT